MSEQITAIEPYEQDDRGFDGGCMAGFLVTTDAQTITLAIDNTSQCCENWGYFMSEDDAQAFVGAELLGVSLTDTARKHYDFPIHADSFRDMATMFVDINTDRGTLQFVAYNEHNGYYGHEAVVRSTQLQHTVRL